MCGLLNRYDHLLLEVCSQYFSYFFALHKGSNLLLASHKSKYYLTTRTVSHIKYDLVLNPFQDFFLVIWFDEYHRGIPDDTHHLCCNNAVANTAGYLLSHPLFVCYTHILMNSDLLAIYYCIDGLFAEHQHYLVGS